MQIARHAPWAARAQRFACIAGAMLLASCVQSTRTSDGRSPSPEPVAPPSTPAEAPANAVVLISRPAVDTNGNLWRDRVELTIYLFAQPFPTPVFRDGDLEFAIFPVGGAGTPQSPGTPLRTWKIDAETLAALRGMSLPGPCYNVAISLLADGGTDLLRLDAVDLAARFRAPGQELVWAQGVTTIQLGMASEAGAASASPASRSAS